MVPAKISKVPNSVQIRLHRAAGVCRLGFMARLAAGSSVCRAGNQFCLPETGSKSIAH